MNEPLVSTPGRGFTGIHIYMYTYIHIYTFTYIHILVLCVYTCVYKYVYIYIYIYMFTHILDIYSYIYSEGHTETGQSCAIHGNGIRIRFWPRTFVISWGTRRRQCFCEHTLNPNVHTLLAVSEYFAISLVSKGTCEDR